MNASTSTEIEKKYLVTRVPADTARLTAIPIEQGYMAISADGTEIRLRKKGGRYFQTVKKGSGLVRTEVEVELTEEQFTVLWPMTEGRRVSKHRYEVPIAGYICELDVFSDSLAGLVLAEVEFASIDESRRFVPPDWFDKDVTEDERYKNKQLARHGMPAIELDTNRETS